MVWTQTVMNIDNDVIHRLFELFRMDRRGQSILHRIAIGLTSRSSQGDGFDWEDEVLDPDGEPDVTTYSVF